MPRTTVVTPGQAHAKKVQLRHGRSVLYDKVDDVWRVAFYRQPLPFEDTKTVMRFTGRSRYLEDALREAMGEWIASPAITQVALYIYTMEGDDKNARRVSR